MRITKRRLTRIIREVLSKKIADNTKRSGTLQQNEARLRRVIKEAFLPNLPYAPIPMKSRAHPDFAAMIKSEGRDMTRDDYEAWVMEKGHITPAASSVLASYAVENMLDKNDPIVAQIAGELGIDLVDVHNDMQRQNTEQMYSGLQTAYQPGGEYSKWSGD
tara:strand:- start:125 stop:607 length:483 start_codon:yes stop_codon:yes gene_type:complete